MTQIILVIVLSIFQFISCAEDEKFNCNHPIYCKGEILEKIQLSQIFNDSKYFVDMPLKVNSEVVISAFQNLPQNSTKEDYEIFIEKYFEEPGSEILQVIPKDWIEYPKITQNLYPELKNFTYFLNKKWKDLLRIFQHNNLVCGSDCYSSLFVPYSFIVAGGRFREFYYWDSYWIIEGLLISEMYETAKHMIENFLFLVKKYGMVPNGGRIYYLNRSQPPILSIIVLRYFEVTKDIVFIRNSIKTLEQEYNFWMNNRNISSKQDLKLNIYNVSNNFPRPESFKEDYELTKNSTVEEKSMIFKNLASACESGWDFSSRWFKSEESISTIMTSNVIPVDLNSILYKVEKSISYLYSSLGNKEKQFEYSVYAKKRKLEIKKYFWNPFQCWWNDFNLITGSYNTNFYLSNIFPLWAGDELFDLKDSNCLLNTIKKLDKFIGGFPTCLVNSGQQWDYPNGWAPLQIILIEALEKLNNKEAIVLAKKLANKWILNNYCGWRKYGTMSEKYRVDMIGESGHGGEYTVQEGFGWTNGVALMLIKKFGNDLLLKECPK